MSTHNTYTTENLTHDDFHLGFTIDYSLYRRYLNARNIERSEKDIYWLEDGYSIDGTKRVKRFHPLLGKTILNKESNKTYIIDCIVKHDYYGEYWVMLARDQKNSHVTLFYQNINSIDKTVLEGIQETRENYSFLDENLNFDIKY